MTKFKVNIVSTSNASDNGLLALADLAGAAEGLEYRVIGGHMVQLLVHALPAPRATIRGTSDADAGIGVPVAMGSELSNRLIERGYAATKGNRYELGEGEESLAVDLLIPSRSVSTQGAIGGREFDVAPGLALAMESEPLEIHVEAQLLAGEFIEFKVQVPNVECAVVMKTLVRKKRLDTKDFADLMSLLEIALEHRETIDWALDGERARLGLRLDTSRELHAIVNTIENGGKVGVGSGVDITRFAAIVRTLVREPPLSA